MDRAHEKRLCQRVVALGNSGAPEAAPELIGLLESPSAQVRRLAVSALGMLKKLKLYQQQGKRVISLYREDKPHLAPVLRRELSRYVRLGGAGDDR